MERLWVLFSLTVLVIIADDGMCWDDPFVHGFSCNVYVTRGGAIEGSCGNSSSYPCATIQQGVDIAVAGDTVCVSASETETYDCLADGVVINKSLKLVSINGMATIDCRGKGRAFHIQSVVAELTGFDMRNGFNNEQAGFILIDPLSTSTIRNCRFTNGFSPWGGAVSTYGNTTIDNCTFIGNTADNHGGCIYSNHFTFDGFFKFINNTFVNNTVAKSDYAYLGGGVLGLELAEQTTMALTFEGNAVIGNTAMASGGAVCVYFGEAITLTGSTFLFERNEFVSNFGALRGGAVSFYHFSSQGATIDSNVFSFTNNLFQNNTSRVFGGAVHIWFQPPDRPATMIVKENSFLFANNTMRNNTAVNGGAIYIDYSFMLYQPLVTNNTNHLRGGDFRNNWATQDGGAVMLMHPPEAVATLSWAPSYPQWIYQGNKNILEDVSFHGNEARCAGCSGGGLTVFSGTTSISNCRFERNRAGLGGGGLLVQGGATMLSIDEQTSFVNNTATVGQHVYVTSSGNLSIIGTAFVVEGSPSFLEVAQGGRVFLDALNVNCSAGSILANSSLPPFIFVEAAFGYMIAQIVSLACEACPLGTYTLKGDRLSEGQLAHRLTCHPCLSLTDCTKGGADVLSAPNQWCYASPSDGSALECTDCPPGYCIQDASQPWRTPCRGHRTGVLCGECEEGYSAAFGGNECVPDKECDALPWGIPALLALGATYVAMLVYSPVQETAWWKSLLYYLQIAPILTGVDSAAIRFVFGVASLDPAILGIRISACPWAGFTSLQKMAADYLVPLLLIFELLACIVLHQVTSWVILRVRMIQMQHEIENHLCRDSSHQKSLGDVSAAVVSMDDEEIVRLLHQVEEKEKEEEMSEDDDIATEMKEKTTMPLALERNKESWGGRFLAAVVGLMMLMYESVTSVTMRLLSCAEVGGTRRLFWAGEVECYAGWQIFLFVVLLVAIIPFPLFLVGLRALIRENKWQKKSQLPGALLRVLERPYVKTRRYFDAVSLFRRLVILSISVFVLAPVWRALGLFLACNAALYVHLYFKPYARDYHMQMETAFLLSLVLLAALQIPHGVYTLLGQPYTDATAQVLEYLQLSLLLLPIGFCLLMILIRHGPRLYHFCKHRLRCLIKESNGTSPCSNVEGQGA